MKLLIWLGNSNRAHSSVDRLFIALKAYRKLSFEFGLQSQLISADEEHLLVFLPAAPPPRTKKIFVSAKIGKISLPSEMSVSCRVSPAKEVCLVPASCYHSDLTTWK